MSIWNAPSHDSRAQLAAVQPGLGRNAARFGVPVATLMTRHLIQNTRHTINPGPDRPDATQTPPRPELIGPIRQTTKVGLRNAG